MGSTGEDAVNITRISAKDLDYFINSFDNTMTV
jgi:hypothetical protein